MSLSSPTLRPRWPSRAREDESSETSSLEAERLLWLLERSPQQRERLRREAWQLCGERFGIERTVARYRSIYRDLIGVA